MSGEHREQQTGTEPAGPDGPDGAGAGTAGASRPAGSDATRALRPGGADAARASGPAGGGVTASSGPAVPDDARAGRDSRDGRAPRRTGAAATTRVEEAAGAAVEAARTAKGTPQQQRRRQARGERRIAQLLEAAAAVFTTTGYTAASTNAIAREAGVSPGTLYQFFPNKEAIAVELGERLMGRLREMYGETLAQVGPLTPLEETIGTVVDRFIDFNTRHPVFFALLHGPDVPGRLAEKHDALYATLLDRVTSLLARFMPDAAPARVGRTARMVLGIYMAGLDLVLAHEGAEREAYVEELKDALVRYLAPLVEDADCEAPPARPGGAPAGNAPAGNAPAG